MFILGPWLARSAMDKGHWFGQMEEHIEENGETTIAKALA